MFLLYIYILQSQLKFGVLRAILTTYGFLLNIGRNTGPRRNCVFVLGTKIRIQLGHLTQRSAKASREIQSFVGLASLC